MPRDRVDPKAVLEKLASESDPAAYLHGFQPNNEQYVALKRELANTEPPSAEPIRISLNGVIKPGDANPQLGKVVALISRHAPASYLAEHRQVLDAHANGDVYDPELVAAIKDYQKLSGSTPDGVIGRNTLSALQGEQSSIKRDRILYSMERLRWLPHDFGTRYVMVNQPAYRAEYFEDGKEKLAMNVVRLSEPPDLFLLQQGADGRFQSVMGRAALHHPERDAAEGHAGHELSRPQRL